MAINSADKVGREENNCPFLSGLYAILCKVKYSPFEFTVKIILPSY